MGLYIMGKGVSGFRRPTVTLFPRVAHLIGFAGRLLIMAVYGRVVMVSTHLRG